MAPAMRKHKLCSRAIIGSFSFFDGNAIYHSHRHQGGHLTQKEFSLQIILKTRECYINTSLTSNAEIKIHRKTCFHCSEWSKREWFAQILFVEKRAPHKGEEALINGMNLSAS